MKRFLCIFLSVVIMLSACMIAFAENTTAITDEYSSDEYCSDYEFEWATEEISDIEENTAQVTTEHAEPTTDSPWYPPAGTKPSENEESTTNVAGIPVIPPSQGGVADSVGQPAWNAFQHLSITFFVSVNSLATVSYHAVAEKNSKIEATVYFEKLVLGKWERVSVGTNGNKFTNRVSGIYISGTQTVQVKGNGRYRAVVEVKNTYGSASGSTEFVFNVNSSLADVNLDGRVTAMDARLALRFAAGLQRYAIDQKARGDVNGDGQLTAADARIILRISAKLM